MTGRAASLIGLLLFGWAAIALDVAPLGFAFRPDLLYCVVATWAVRRPASTPVLAVFLLGLLGDLTAGGPIGPEALGLVIASEGLRGWARVRRRSPLAAWGAVAGWLAAPLLLPWLILTLTLAPAPPLTDLAARFAATALIWPLIALALRWSGLQAAAASQAEARRRA